MRVIFPIRLILIFIAILFCNGIIYANTINNGGEWNKVAFNGNLFSPNWHYRLETNLRFNFPREQMFSQNVNRIGIGYSIANNLSIWAGYVFAPTNSNGSLLYDQRAWQQLSWKIYQNNAINLSSRTRLEQRWLEGATGTAVRLRQRLKLTFPAVYKNVRPMIFDEIFFNLTNPDWVNPQLVNQNRAFVGLIVPLSKSLNFTFGYLNQYLPNIPTSAMNHIAYFELDKKLS